MDEPTTESHYLENAAAVQDDDGTAMPVKPNNPPPAMPPEAEAVPVDDETEQVEHNPLARELVELKNRRRQDDDRINELELEQRHAADALVGKAVQYLASKGYDFVPVKVEASDEPMLTAALAVAAVKRDAEGNAVVEAAWDLFAIEQEKA